MARVHPHRTYLFAPGNHPRKVEKAFGLNADAVILDLEDAVALSEKVETRATVVEALKAPRPCAGFVRVNAFDTDFCFGDLKAVVGPWIDGIMLPKVESAADLQAMEWVVANLERLRGVDVGSIDLLPIIETAKGLDAVREIAQAGTRIKRLSFGAGDYTRDLGMDWSLRESELEPVRAEMVLASRLGGLEPPVDSVFIHIREEDALKASAARVKALGFQGKLCIHPNQVAPVNETFTPKDEEVIWSQKIVDAFAEAEKAGSASIQVDGYFVDYPIVEKAQRTLDLAAAIKAASNN